MVKNKKLTIHSKILQSVYTCIHYSEISTLYIQPTKIVIGNLIFVVGGNLYNFHLQLILHYFLIKLFFIVLNYLFFIVYNNCFTVH